MNLQNVYAVILCGGLGTRLRGVIGESQKVMADINGHPFLDIIIRYLNGQGIQRIILSAGYKAEMISKGKLAEKKLMVEEVVQEQKPLGTAGALKHPSTKVLIKGKNFFVLNGDSFCNVNLRELLDTHLKNKAEATMVVSFVKDASDYGSVEIDDHNRIKGFQEKQKGSLNKNVNAGIYCFNKSVLDLISEGDSLEKNIFPRLVNKKTLYVMPTSEIFLDIGTPERYAQAQEYFAKRKN